MTYCAKLAVDITFHSRGDLIEYLEAIHARTDATSTERAWAILAGLSEYAVGTLAGLRLTGRGSGQLMDGYTDRLAGLAHHADGAVTACAEDEECWEHCLVRGHVITFTGRSRPNGAHAPSRPPNPDREAAKSPGLLPRHTRAARRDPPWPADPEELR